MQSYQLPHLPPHLSSVHAALFKDVSDAAQLRQRLITASTAEGPDGTRARDALNFAFIEARLITSLQHLRTAIHQAVMADALGSLRTRTVHSEIIWSLNPTNNISEAMRRYGVSDTSTSLVVVRIDSPELSVTDIERDMDAAVNGTKVPFADLRDITDWTAVKKYHKLGNEVAIQQTKGDVDRERGVVDEIATSSVAMKMVMG
ncbi:kinase binding protein CGI-121-domain-containing protein [Roridomyces roridus]|uniref:EKC/KEOPS complex subunit CGI121 n=1 Tax=Roridomyces roridus TaxID=1738132 RepID=A0AAD7CBD3_9AGAR|nr:kinase binding protein CGI-121-domain-containing protein [Roridomyces roridus]